VACVLDDRDRAESAIARFIAAAQTTEARDDLTTGRAGQLVGCASLLEAVRAAGYTEGPLLEFGRSRQRELTETWTSCTTAVVGAGDPFLGVAHGWAGLAFAALRFSALSFEPVAPAVEPADNGQLCCGSAGQAYASLTLHRLTGDGRYVDRARALLDRSMTDRSMTSIGSPGMRRDSLYKAVGLRGFGWHIGGLARLSSRHRVSSWTDAARAVIRVGRRGVRAGSSQLSGGGDQLAAGR
jgi:hypothetical protein